MEDKICAVIISYNSNTSLLYRCIERIYPQVGSVIVIDNNSFDESTKTFLKEIQNIFPSLFLKRNKKNIGLAAALNQGVEIAMMKNFEWIITLDDDSIPDEMMIKTMMDSYSTLDNKIQNLIGILAPNYETPKGSVYKTVYPIYIPTTITSGQIIKADTFKKIGYFRESFFIECIDHEFCLRALKHNLRTLLISNATLHQRIGDPTVRRILWKKIVVANHNYQRYYFLYRNSMYLYKNYFFVAKKWIIQNIISNIVLLGKIVFFESGRIKKIMYIFYGCVDGLRDNYSNSCNH